MWAPTTNNDGWSNVTTKDCFRLNFVTCDDSGNVSGAAFGSRFAVYTSFSQGSSRTDKSSSRL